MKLINSFFILFISCSNNTTCFEYNKVGNLKITRQSTTLISNSIPYTTDIIKCRDSAIFKYTYDSQKDSLVIYNKRGTILFNNERGHLIDKKQILIHEKKIIVKKYLISDLLNVKNIYVSDSIGLIRKTILGDLSTFVFDYNEDLILDW